MDQSAGFLHEHCQCFNERPRIVKEWRKIPPEEYLHGMPSAVGLVLATLLWPPAETPATLFGWQVGAEAR